VFKSMVSSFLAAAAVLFTIPSFAIPVHLRVIDSSGADLADQLLILKSLETGREAFRACSDSKGDVPTRDVSPGPYRVIVTDPYGAFETEVIEFMVVDAPVQIEVKVSPLPTHGYGDWIGKRQPELRLRFVLADGKPGGKVTFLMRDEKAIYEQWFHSNDDGTRTISPMDWTALPFDGPITIVVLRKTHVVTKIFTVKDLSRSRASGKALTISLD